MDESYSTASDEEREPPPGFTITRVLPGHPEAVFAHFVEPEPFSRWFVVEGFSTPASRVELDVRPGGTIRAVMVEDGGSTQIPFTARYGRVEPPHLVQFIFTDPDEVVTLGLLDLGADGTQLTYANEGAPISGRAGVLAAAHRMIDALASSLGVDPGPSR